MKRMLVAAALLAAAPAAAQERPAGINFQSVLVDPDGRDIVDCARIDDKANPPRCAEEAPLTLGRIAMTALLAPDAATDGSEQLRRWNLAQRIYKNPSPVVLDAGEITLIKTLIAKRGNPIWTGQSFLILDPASVKR